MQIHRLSPDEALRALASSDQGLSDAEAADRLREFGANELRARDTTHYLGMLSKQFTHLLAVLLWAAAALAFFAEYVNPGEGMALLGWAILGVILVNALFSFFQEYKAERAIMALRRLLPLRVKVVRSGETRDIAARDLVPGDLVILGEGARVPADGRVITATEFRVNNAALTGESIPLGRRPEAAAGGTLLESPNIVFAGTGAVSGTARVVIFATGMNTEFGRIAHLASGLEVEMSPLQQQIVGVTRLIATISVAVGAGFFVLGVAIGRGFWENFIFAVGILVANVPEGLLPTVTLALAVGAQRMARRKALIKNLPSVETLGCATVICTDKTGTLTENRMAVSRLYIDAREVRVSGASLTIGAATPVPADLLASWMPLFRIATGCNNARWRSDTDLAGRAFVGDPTEAALLRFVSEVMPDLDSGDVPPRIQEFPFDPDRKRMATVHVRRDGGKVAYVKGAPELLLPLCDVTYRAGATAPLDDEERRVIVDHLNAFAESALRVLALAYRELPDGPHPCAVERVERKLIFVALVGLMDPPRPEVPEAVRRCEKAGVKTIMITGDNSRTAVAIARAIGMVRGASPIVLEGHQVEAMRDEEVGVALDAPEVHFARMTPVQKMRIVMLLRERGHVVAVTGDGVNDAPALKAADIGVAMGISGTDVAKEAADIVLLDDNFATIVNAIEEGRAVFDNIRKFATYILASNVPEIVPYLAFVVLRVPLLLTVIQILGIDLGTDMLPALGLGAEPPDPRTMERPPRRRQERLLNVPVLARAYLFLGPIQAAVAVGAGLWYLSAAGWEWGLTVAMGSPLHRQATTVSFAAIVLCQVANVFVCRSPIASSFTRGLGGNRLLAWGVVAELALLGIIVYHPIGQWAFGTASFEERFWLPLLAGASVFFSVEEGRKGMVRRRLRKTGLGRQEGTA
jgi:sodium/potassium-transporting ATPase subunit alpha